MQDTGAPPRFVPEVASEDTRDRDRDDKPAIYLEVGADEYWRLDPAGGDFYTPILQGDRRVGGAWEPIQVTLDDGRLRGHSRALGLDLHAEPDRLRFRGPNPGLWLPDYDDTCEALNDTRQVLDETRQALNEPDRRSTTPAANATPRPPPVAPPKTEPTPSRHRAAARSAAEAELAALRARRNDRNGDAHR